MNGLVVDKVKHFEDGDLDENDDFHDDFHNLDLWRRSQWHSEQADSSRLTKTKNIQ